MTTDNTPRIYVADLAARNNGDLIGQWIDLDAGMDVDDLTSIIETKVLLPGNEEWSVDDYEGFGTIRLNEHVSLDTVLAHVERMDDDPGKYFAWVANVGQDYADGYDADKVDGPYASLSEWFDGYIENVFGSYDLAEVLTDNGMDKRAAASLAELVTWIDADQFALIMSCNAGISLTEVPGYGFYAVDNT